MGKQNHSGWFGCDKLLQFPQKVRLLKNSNVIEIVSGNSCHRVNQSILVVHCGGKTSEQDPSEAWMSIKEVPTGDFHCSLH